MEQDTTHNSIRRVKIILWFGVILIILIGTATAVYFIFLKDAGNDVPAHEAVTPLLASLFNGEVSTECAQDSDCQLVDKTEDHSECCPLSSCTDYASDDWVAVNSESAQQLFDAASEPCERKDLDCPQYISPQCPENNNSMYSAKCVGEICMKAFDNQKESDISG